MIYSRPGDGVTDRRLSVGQNVMDVGYSGCNDLCQIETNVGQYISVRRTLTTVYSLKVSVHYICHGREANQNQTESQGRWRILP